MSEVASPLDVEAIDRILASPAMPEEFALHYVHISKDDLKSATDCLVEGMPWLLDNDPKVISIHSRN